MRPAPEAHLLPRAMHAVREALRLDRPDAGALSAMRENEWPGLLQWCDRRQITLLLHELHAARLPSEVAEQMAAARDRYDIRYARLQRDLFEIDDALGSTGIEFVLLKGMSHAPDLTPDPRLRAQGDIDLWFAADSIEPAVEALRRLGYRSSKQGHDHGRHLPPMARPHSWKWRGDLFDPKMPIHVEPHFRLWDSRAEGIAMPDESAFWDRRTVRQFDGRPFSVLCAQDLLGFAALHFLLHLLHGDLPLQRGWEIARFLDRHAADDAFWLQRQSLHSGSLRLLENVAFAIVLLWFHGEVHPSVQEEMRALPAGVRLWLEHYGLSPFDCWSRPNKDELWLHLALVHSLPRRVGIVLRRLFPTRLDRKGGLVARAAHHRRTFTPTVCGALRWAWLNWQNARASGSFAPR
jgi:hypothetical protein